jgi:predicted tellurium resistance membrane protein TerC
VVFAVDSGPAVLAVSRSQFIVFTSSAFAILAPRTRSCTSTSAWV